MNLRFESELMRDQFRSAVASRKPHGPASACPICLAEAWGPLVFGEVATVIDHCSACQHVFFDGGELEHFVYEGEEPPPPDHMPIRADLDWDDAPFDRVTTKLMRFIDELFGRR